MKIALDFDSVLSDTMIPWVNAYNKRFNKSITKETHILKWEFWDDLDISDKIAFDIFDEVWTEWRQLPPTETNLKEKIENLSTYGQIDVVTEIKEKHILNVKYWLKEHDIPYNDLVPAKGKKASLDYDYFIDDYGKFAIQCSQNGKNCLLYDQPWNRKIEGNKITRIKKLKGALDIINKKSI